MELSLFKGSASKTRNNFEGKSFEFVARTKDDQGMTITTRVKIRESNNGEIIVNIVD